MPTSEKKNLTKSSVSVLAACLPPVFMLFLALPMASAQAHISLPFEEEGVIGLAPYRIVVPANWNGTLLIWAHGARDKADHPGEIDNRSPEAAPLGSPLLEQLFLQRGFALAGSAFRDNGNVVKEGLLDTVSLTNFFKGRVGHPEHTIIWGASMGGQIALQAIEKFSGLYDGAVPICAAGGGGPRNQDAWTAFALAYEVAFGWPASWGAPEDVRNDIDFETEVLPVVLSQLGNPGNFGRFEFMRLVNGMPAADFLSGPFPSLFAVLLSATEGRSVLERKAGDGVVQNLDHVYSLTPAERTYLTATLGVDADALLAAMSARRYVAVRSARNYLVNFSDVTGITRRPILSMHTTVDGLVLAAHESVLKELVEAQGNGTLLVQVFTSGVGHCAFSPAQLLTVVGAMDSWVRTGVRPGPEVFPAALGFVPGFQPPPFPYQP
jgi:pimeloyl-ACP methyl ester carboxylesterase